MSPVERAQHLRAHAHWRTWAKAHQWRERVAVWDDARDAEMQAALAADITDMRRRHANVGKELLARCILYFEDLTTWKPSELLRLAEFARRMEVGGLVGTDRDLSTGPTAATASTPAGDEWDRLAADLSTTAAVGP